MKTIKYYHKQSYVVAFERVGNSDRGWVEYTYNEKGDQLTSKDSDGFWTERTCDEKGNQLTYKSSNGIYRIKSKDVNKEEFEQFFKPKPCLGKKVIVDGVEYTLS